MQCVCASAHAREKKREEEEQREKAEKERSKQGVCFWISVWEVEPHLLRMPCLTPCSPLRFLGASLFFAASKLWYYLFISHLQLFWESLEMVTWCEASLWSVMHNLYLPLTVQHCWQWSDEVRWKKSLLKSQLEPWLNLTIEDWIRAHLPLFPVSWQGSKHLFLTWREKLLTDVCASTRRECCALSHTHEKPWKTLHCVDSVLRQCLSLAGWRKQSHRFLILIPFYCFSPIDHLAILNEMDE